MRRWYSGEVSGSSSSGPKSAYELALERLENQGIERPREDALSEQVREQMADIRRRAEAKLAELEILHRQKRGKTADPAAREKAEQEYAAERQRIESRRDRDLERLRQKRS